jgi:hypothetical protein
MNADEHRLKTSNLLGALSVFIRFYSWPLHSSASCWGLEPSPTHYWQPEKTPIASHQVSGAQTLHHHATLHMPGLLSEEMPKLVCRHAGESPPHDTRKIRSQQLRDRTNENIDLRKKTSTALERPSKSGRFLCRWLPMESDGDDARAAIRKAGCQIGC